MAKSLKLIFAWLLFLAAGFSDLHAQEYILNENFGSVIFWDGPATAYTGFSSKAKFSNDSIRIMAALKSDYTGSSGGSCLVFDKNANSDTLILTGINVKYYKDLFLSMGVNAQKDPEKAFQAAYSTDGLSWTDIDKSRLTSGDWPAKLKWGYVSFADTIPLSETLQLRFNNTIPDEYLYLDDIRISGTYDSTAVDFISGLRVDAGIMTPAFSPSVNVYNVLLPFGTTLTPAVIINVPVSQAEISVNQATDVTSNVVQKRTTTITVTSGDGNSVRVYSVVFRVDDKEAVFFEDFDNPGIDQYIGPADAFNFKTTGVADFSSVDTIKIDPWGNKFTEGSGYRRLYISPYDHLNYDTITFSNIDVSKSKELELSFAFRWNTAWLGIDKCYPTVEVKVDDGKWINYGEIAGADAFPGALTWAVVRIGGLPEGDTLSVRFSGEKNSGSAQEYYIDDLSLLGKPLCIDATLSLLTVTGAVLEPPFNPDIVEYRVVLEPSVTDMPAIKALENDSCATVNIFTAKDMKSAEADARTATIVVTAENGATGNYYITFEYRPLASEAHLSLLQCDPGMLSPLFSPDIYNYQMELPTGYAESPLIEAVPADSNAMVALEPAQDLYSEIDAERTAVISVTAEDGLTIEKYTILFHVSTTGITSSKINAIRVWPNPASDNITIETTTVFDRLEIFSRDGKLLSVVNTAGTDHVDLSTSGLDPGLYIFRFFDHGKLTGTARIVKK